MGQDMAQWSREEGIQQNARDVVALRQEVAVLREALRTVGVIAAKVKDEWPTTLLDEIAKLVAPYTGLP